MPAASDPTQLSTSSAAPLTPLLHVGSTLFNISAISAVDSQSAPVGTTNGQVTLSVDPDLVDAMAPRRDGTRLTLAYIDPDSGAWVPLATRVMDDGKLAADSDHLGQFGVLIEAAQLTVCVSDGATLWSDAGAGADSFGPASAGTPYTVLGQVGQRYFVQDSAGKVGWLDVAMAGACPAPSVTSDDTLSAAPDASAAVPVSIDGDLVAPDGN
jgi:hypothetical protein